MVEYIHNKLVKKGFEVSYDQEHVIYDLFRNNVVYKLIWTNKKVWFYKRNLDFYKLNSWQALAIAFFIPSKITLYSK